MQAQTVIKPDPTVVLGKMKRSNKRLLIGAGLLTTVGLVTALIYTAAQRDIGAAHARVQTGGGRVIDTPCGRIEYAEVGKGEPVLLIHGTSGGYVQGLLFVKLLGDGFRYIIPSRFGYLNTPLPADATPVAQAAAHLCLLDALHIRRTAVWATSAGALSALELAARAPDRVSALALVSPDTWSPNMEISTSPMPPAVNDLIANVILRSDLAMWLLAKIAHPVLLSFLALPPEVAARLTPDERSLVDELVSTLFTVSLQKEGLINDNRNHVQRQRAPLEQIKAPTLVVSAADDPFKTLAGAEYTAQHISGARLIRVPSGGHLLMGGLGGIWTESARFLTMPASATH